MGGRRIWPGAWVGGLLLLGLGIWRYQLDGDPSMTFAPPAALPVPNAYPDYRSAAELASHAEGAQDAGPAMPLAQREALLRQDRKAIETLRRGFAHPYRQPRNDPSPAFMGCRSLGWSLRTEADLNAARGDLAGAARSDVDGIRFGEDLARGAPLIGERLRSEAEEPAAEGLRRIADRLDDRSARSAVRALNQLLATRVSPYQSLQEEKWTEMAGLLALFHRPEWRRELADRVVNENRRGGGGLETAVAFRLSKRRIVEDVGRAFDEALARCRERDPESARVTHPMDDPAHARVTRPGDDPAAEALLPDFEEARRSALQHRAGLETLRAKLDSRAHRPGAESSRPPFDP